MFSHAYLTIIKTAEIRWLTVRVGCGALMTQTQVAISPGSRSGSSIASAKKSAESSPPQSTSVEIKQIKVVKRIFFQARESFFFEKRRTINELVSVNSMLNCIWKFANVLPQTRCFIIDQQWRAERAFASSLTQTITDSSQVNLNSHEYLIWI